MFGYFFHGIFRKIVIGFGTLFNDVHVKRFDNNGNTTSTIKVPIQYGPTQKFLSRIEQAPKDLNNPQQLTLPMMSYEFNGIAYNNEDKLPATQKFYAELEADKTKIRSVFMPVPYVMSFELNIMAKTSEDIWQVTEQILPYFHPSYTISINLIKEIGETRDIPITLKSVEIQDDYEGNYESRRVIIYTLRFDVKTYLFGPTKDATDGLVKKVSIGYVAGSTDDDPEKARRDITYQVTGVATKSYTNNVVSYLVKDVSYIAKIIYLNDIDPIPLYSTITIDEESMKVMYKDTDNNALHVERATYNTTNAIHVKGSGVQLVTEADNALIQPGDNFDVASEIIGFID